jgi:hypothetical protein
MTNSDVPKASRRKGLLFPVDDSPSALEAISASVEIVRGRIKVAAYECEVSPVKFSSFDDLRCFGTPAL